MTTTTITKRLFPWIRSVAIWIGTVALAVVVAKGIQHARDGEAPPRSATAPSIEGVEFQNGRPTVLYFWATWCGVCRVQSPIVAAVASETTSCGHVVELEESTSRGAFASYGVRVLPTIVVVDGAGKISDRYLGLTTKWQLVGAMRRAGGSC